MNYLYVLVVVATIALFLFLKRNRFIPEQQARAFLKSGAKVVDVRTDDEYREKHIPGALHIPLKLVSTECLKQVPDKNHVLLLHCAAGVRSAMAMKALRGLGYKHAYNLGSYDRAASIAAASESARASS